MELAEEVKPHESVYGGPHTFEVLEVENADGEIEGGGGTDTKGIDASEAQPTGTFDPGADPHYSPTGRELESVPDLLVDTGDRGAGIEYEVPRTFAVDHHRDYERGAAGTGEAEVDLTGRGIGGRLHARRCPDVASDERDEEGSQTACDPARSELHRSAGMQLLRPARETEGTRRAY
jgi:hypothetical protein